ncbi:MAG TPA: DNA-directed RNA polymerase subunit beta, partial [Methylomirabilota bacterium]
LESVDLSDVDLKTLRVASKTANERIRATIDMAAKERAKVEEKAEDQIDKILQPDELPPGVIQLVKVYIAEKRKISVGDKMAGRHGNKGIVARIVPEEDMPFLPDGSPVDIVLNPLGVPSRMNVGQILETHLGWCARLLGFEAKTPVFRGADEGEIGILLRLAGLGWARQALELKAPAPVLEGRDIARLAEDLKHVAAMRLEQAGVSHLLDKGMSAENRKIGEAVKAFVAAAARELGEREAAQRQVELARHQEQGADAKLVKELEQLVKGGPVAALNACGRTALAAVLENGKDADLDAAADEVLRVAGLTPAGKARLRDGRSGQFFEGDVTVGSIYMLKLSHLVDDKIHARSIGPYSLITQQPLGGKAQFGGQRFGEMEVWALEAYGAAHILQELLTAKSDDVYGRAKIYEAIVKGDTVFTPGVPESFNVLIRELQSLCLDVELIKTKH